MNSTVTFPSAIPELKLPRATEKWAAALAEERRRLQEDQDALREREGNLREYEARLRGWQAELDATRAGVAARPAVPTTTPVPGAPLTTLPRPSRSPFTPEDPMLQAAWEKLHRARELLEAEQLHLRDDRIAIREQEIANKVRAEQLAQREAALAKREALVAAAVPPKKGKSAVQRITQAPFDMARSVFGGDK